jgi:uncharacterized repeat protein (TIGR04138 family)
MVDNHDSLPQDARKPLGTIAEEVGFPVDAITLVADVGPYMARRCMYMGRSHVAHTDAHGFCKQLLLLAIESFGSARACTVMENWGIYRSEDIGRIVFALVHTGWLEASETDAESDFAGLGTVQQLFGSGFGQQR